MAEPDTAADEPTPNFSCLYFGFASNLSSRSLQQRCPGSLYVGLGVLEGWKFIISELGFGNIVPGEKDDVVYGALYFLTPQHEAALDKSEEVPNWHRKFSKKVKMLRDGDGGADGWRNGREVDATCYIDTVRTSEGRMSKEYIVLMRKAIADGLHLGVPADYFERYMSKFLPEGADVGQEEKLIMLRTVQHDKNDLQYVPSWLLGAQK